MLALSWTWRELALWVGVGMSQIFLSHSSFDNGTAVALRNWLIAEGWEDLFLDLDPKRGIAGGQRWQNALYEAANNCEAVVFLVSRHWLKSAMCVSVDCRTMS